MSPEGRKSHWEDVYSSKAEGAVSWFQEAAVTSLDLLEHAGIAKGRALIDVGGGASRLVDALLARGYEDVTVLDLSAAALAASRTRLGVKASGVHWIEADITRWLPERQYAVWHDRAVLHFLTMEPEREAYLRALHQAVCPGGLIVIATFALDGPEKCSGLPVQRYSPATLSLFLGEGFELRETRAEVHTTPWGAGQKFQFSSFLRKP